MDYQEDPDRLHEYYWEQIITAAPELETRVGVSLSYEPNSNNLSEEILFARSQIASEYSGQLNKILGMQNSLEVIQGLNTSLTAARYKKTGDWDVRTRGLQQVIRTAQKYQGPDAKGIILAHNTHVGDVRGLNNEEFDRGLSLGQLVRESEGQENVLLVGMGSYQGTVMIGDSWGGTGEIVRLLNRNSESWGNVLHGGRSDDFLVVFDERVRNEPGIRQWRGLRAVGCERSLGDWSYDPTDIAERFDAFVLFSSTDAVTPLPGCE
jgi:erythromycin esterase-like protein